MQQIYKEKKLVEADFDNRNIMQDPDFVEGAEITRDNTLLFCRHRCHALNFDGMIEHRNSLAQRRIDAADDKKAKAKAAADKKRDKAARDKVTVTFPSLCYLARTHAAHGASTTPPACPASLCPRLSQEARAKLKAAKKACTEQKKALAEQKKEQKGKEKELESAEKELASADKDQACGYAGYHLYRYHPHR